MLSCLLQHVDFVVFLRIIIMLTLLVIPFADLPPSKRRKGVANTVINTAFSAALVGAAVGLTVYRMYVRTTHPTPFWGPRATLITYIGGEIKEKMTIKNQPLRLHLMKKNGQNQQMRK